MEDKPEFIMISLQTGPFVHEPAGALVNRELKKKQDVNGFSLYLKQWMMCLFNLKHFIMVCECLLIDWFGLWVFSVKWKWKRGAASHMSLSEKHIML